MYKKGTNFSGWRGVIFQKNETGTYIIIFYIKGCNLNIFLIKYKILTKRMKQGSKSLQPHQIKVNNQYNGYIMK